MLHFVRSLAVVTAALSASSAFATSFTCRDALLTRIHFSGTAFGKAVAGVYAHVGALDKAPQSRGGAETWSDVKHVELGRDSNGDFSGSAIVFGGSAYESSYLQGAIIQYWVYFADGTEMVTDATLISRVRKVQADSNVEGHYERLFSYERDALNATTMIYETNVVQVEECHTS